MRLSGSQFIYASKYFISSVALIAILFMSNVALADDQDAHEDKTEICIENTYTKLKISPDQHRQWSKVDLAMLEDADTMDVLTQSRMELAKKMIAADDLKSKGESEDLHANRIKKLSPVFADLNSGMSDKQNKGTDILLKEGLTKYELKIMAHGIY